ncbi:hypothetical protein [Collimonas sp.]|jgi:hypothetical protein|uniref:hypothetical protein n=1 Tax=Collimonas sp. TaxID=1963772 RepID=UPI002D7E66D7|nr:hypothetical protein [Collimonas sp.]
MFGVHQSSLQLHSGETHSLLIDANIFKIMILKKNQKFIARRFRSLAILVG